jgi:peptidyl-prolyl cis-trans isomerase A (cyclophilin A)
MRRTPILLALTLVPGLFLFLGLDAAATAAADDKPVVVIDTSMGKITIELDAKNAPKTTANFLKYVDSKFYDGLIFHRVMSGFMIQGGGHDETLKEKEEGVQAPIRNESSNGLKNDRGAIAMARLSDPHSATCQFFINHKDNPRLDELGYAVFGKVVDGMNVVDKIASVRTTTRRGPDGRALGNVPVEPVVIKSIRRKDKS